jgi:hypothetical protein
MDMHILAKAWVKNNLFHFCLYVGHVARMGEKRNVYRLLVGKPEGKRPLGRPSMGG